MRISKRAITILFGILVVAFTLGTILLFTPQGSGSNNQTALWVNGKAVSELELARLQQSNTLFSSNPQGSLKPLLDTYFINQVVLLQALGQDARRVRISGNEVTKQINQLKQRYGVKNNSDYSRMIQSLGYSSDSQLRANIANYTKINKRMQEVQSRAKVTEVEAQLYFKLHKDNYRAQDKIVARQIVVDNKKLAGEVYQKARAGEGFSALAKQYSKVGANQGGALGAKPGSTTPTPVTRIVFPTPVATAAFALVKGGLTAPVASGGRYYIVQVERFIPGSNVTFADVKDRVMKDARKVAQDGAQETYIRELKNQAQIKLAPQTEQRFTYIDPVVASVNGKAIKLSKVETLVFSNSQVPRLIQRGLGDLAVQFFFPQVIDQEITQALLVNEAKKLGQPFFGTPREIAQEVELYHTRSLTVTPAEVQKYYKDNLRQFTTPASARVQVASFKGKAAAETYRASLIKGGNASGLAKKLGGTYKDAGVVNSGTLSPVLDKLIFQTRAPLTTAKAGGVTEVVKLSDGSFEVATVTNYQKAATKTFKEVRVQAETRALSQKRAQAVQAWITKLKRDAKITNNWSKVLAEITPKQPVTPSSTTPSGASGALSTPSPTSKAVTPSATGK